MIDLIHTANVIAKAYQLGNSGDDMICPVSDDLMHAMGLSKGLPATFYSDVKERFGGMRELLSIPSNDNTSQQRDAFNGQSVVLLNESKPILDTYEIFLSRDWGFNCQFAANAQELDHGKPLSDAVVILEANDTPADRDKYAHRLSDLKCRGVIVLLNRHSQESGVEQVAWPAGEAIMLETPISGRKLLSAISKVLES